MNEDVNQDEDAVAPAEAGGEEVPEADAGLEAEDAAEAADEALADSLPDDLSEEFAPAGSDGKSTAFMGVPIEIIISVGKARPLVSDLVNLRRDSVIALDSKIDDPVEIFIGDRLIARGELQEMESEDGQLGVRLTEVADLSNGV